MDDFSIGQWAGGHRHARRGPVHGQHGDRPGAVHHLHPQQEHQGQDAHAQARVGESVTE